MWLLKSSFFLKEVAQSRRSVVGFLGFQLKSAPGSPHSPMMVTVSPPQVSPILIE